ncbi:hypothetical protein [Nocardia miyunensis]|uniref:hypothetical protein n=1 Tax=Nocardia miyunensis TaxID=282684 RepID=UPI00083495D6|nr:hypothetical protein [Nocardia miyunensis]
MRSVGALVVAAILARLLRDTTRCEGDLDPGSRRSDTSADLHAVVIVIRPSPEASVDVVITVARPASYT